MLSRSKIANFLKRSIQGKFYLLWIFFSLFLTNEAYAQSLAFMDFNHPEEDQLVVYSLEVSNCEISPSSPIDVGIFSPTAQSRRAPNLLEKVYFGVSHQDVTKGKFSFNLSSLENVTFTIELVPAGKNRCALKKYATYKEVTYEFDQIRVNYQSNLAFPTLDEVLFLKDGALAFKVENYQALGYFPFYELKLGAGINITSNIRPHDNRTFHKRDPIIEPMPLMMVRYGPLFLSNDGLGTLLLPFKYFTVLAAFIAEGEPYEADHIRERKRLIHFGPIIKSSFLEIHYYREVQDTHRGQVLKVSLAPEINLLSNVKLTPRVYYQFWDQRYVDYYFGVNDEEAPYVGGPYAPSEAKNYGAEIRTTILYKKLQFETNLGVKYYGDSVVNSPLAVRNHELRFFTGFLYNFF